MMLVRSHPAFAVRLFATVLALASALTVAPPAAYAGSDEESPWPDIRATLYGGDRQIHDADGVIELETPYRALDAATVPLTIKADIDQTEQRYIRKITLVIDQNPAPVVGTFTLSPANGIASISTRVRINAYTNVRAIAETSDGELYMTKAFVKASGGCSAPATKDADAAMARLGKMKLKQIGTWRKGEPSEAQFMVSHPNYSGMQVDQLTQLWIPARYVRQIDLTLGDRPVLHFEGDISMSENPSIRFYVKPKAGDVLHATVTDSDGATFKQDWPIELGSAS